ncbi:hypothetical protein BAE44_0022769, partial [Dichanthelium oligosanthes]
LQRRARARGLRPLAARRGAGGAVARRRAVPQARGRRRRSREGAPQLLARQPEAASELPWKSTVLSQTKQSRSREHKWHVSSPSNTLVPSVRMPRLDVSH